MTITHVAMMTIQEKTQSYVERALGDDFILVVIDHMGVFIFVLIHLWLLVHKLLTCIVSYYQQYMSMALQHA